MFSTILPSKYDSSSLSQTPLRYRGWGLSGADRGDPFLFHSDQGQRAWTNYLSPLPHQWTLDSCLWEIYHHGPGDGELVIMRSIKIIDNPMQFLKTEFYIVTGGSSTVHNHNHPMASTEILKKNGGTAWATVASLPSARIHVSGVSIPNGNFLVSGV